LVTGLVIWYLFAGWTL